MTATESAIDSSSEDQVIEEMHRVFEGQLSAFARQSYPSATQRREWLGALAGMVLSNRTRIHDALREDFLVHPDVLADLAEVLSTAGRAQQAMLNVETWMQPASRDTDPSAHGSTTAHIRYQPKGVIGIISPWNFPFDLSLGPAVDALAAGNRVMIKPSELAPACSALLEEITTSTFGDELLAVVTGGPRVAEEFASVPWGHLVYTGSTHIGRLVAQAAAKNLTPVTLELGGKSPALVLDDAVNSDSVADIIGTKMLKNGQMCIAPDYVLVPRSRLQDFVRLATEHYRRATPDYANSGDCTGIISERHLARLTSLLDDARQRGGQVVALGQDHLDGDTRRMPMSLVLEPDDYSPLMTEEIFGPILPVKAYDSLDAAIEFINSRPRPLGVYVFSQDIGVANAVIDRTASGGACINACGWQGALPALGFGGVADSGTGRHHGIDGFHEFSNPRGVVTRGEGGVMSAFLPPYGEFAHSVVDAAFRPPLQ